MVKNTKPVKKTTAISNSRPQSKTSLIKDAPSKPSDLLPNEMSDLKRKIARRPVDEPQPESSRNFNRPKSKTITQKCAPTETREEENIRGRRTLKHLFVSSREPGLPICTFCKEVQKPEDEELLECAECNAKYHIKKCLRYKNDFAGQISKLNEWLCARCIVCTGCKGFISDPSNVECSLCCRAWHGSCSPKGHYVSEDFDSDWYCSTCWKSSNYREMHQRKTSRLSPASKRRKNRAVKDHLVFEGDIEGLKELLTKRDYTWELLSYGAGFTSNEPDPLVSTSPSKNNKSSEDEIYYSNTAINSSIPKVVRRDVQLFEEAKSEAYLQKSHSSVLSDGQYLHFGTGKSCKAIYRSAYDEPLYSAPHLYACKFCLHTTNLKEDLVIHWNHCTVKHPPGNEIYRDGDLSFFEVDGAAQKKYCQDLCLLAKLFIASKTLYDEVETFTFYLLCEITTEGYVIVGYFSKEKNPSKNNNLSCLLVLPMVQKMGYGRLLIDMSYELSRLEHRIGHPEHPLSDLGILAYRGYWRSSLLCYLRKHRNLDRINIKDMCLATRIAPIDIVNQLMLDNLIVFKEGVYSIKIGKRALKFPLSQCRRRFVNPTRLIWSPKPARERLDPTKINSYI